MTERGFVIQPGEAIPEDVTAFTDSDGAHATRIENPLQLPWRIAECGTECATHDREDFDFPLTVTAVREQPAEPQRACWKCGLTVGDVVDRGAGAYADGRLRFMHAYGNCPTADELPSLGLTVTAAGEQPAAKPCCDLHGRNCEQGDECCYLCTEAHHFAPGHGGVTCSAPDLSVPPAAESESVDLLDLVQQYGDQRERFISCVGCNTLDESRSHEQAGHALLARIEAEVNRLRAEGARLESDNARLKRIHASDEQSVLQVIGERDEAQDWADRLSQAIAEYLRIDIGEHSNMNLPWQAALIALTDAVSPAASTTSGPLVLSLPSVPDGAVALIAEDGTRYKRIQSSKHDSMWSNGSSGPVPLSMVLETEGSVSVVMREPRTWPKLDGAPEDLKAVKGASGVVYPRDPSGLDIFGPSRMSLATLQRTDGPLVEVFDEDGTR